jgi:hypothetical protein
MDAIAVYNYSFLLSGPTFELELPGDFEAAPELASPLSNRSFNFLPVTHDMGIGSDGYLVETVAGVGGRQVAIYQLYEPPLTWFLRWPLENGALYSHHREEDGYERTHVTADHVEIVEHGSPAIPFLLPTRPVVSSVGPMPGYQEWATFHSSTRSDWSVTLARPSFMRAGDIRYNPDEALEGRVYFRAGTELDIEIGVATAKDQEGGRQLTSMVLDTLSER